MSIGFEPLFNNLLAYSVAYSSTSPYIQKSTISQRAFNCSACIGGTLVTIPVELLTAAENLLLKLPLAILSTGIKVGLYTSSVPFRAIGLTYFANNLCRTAGKMDGPLKVLTTALKVVGFTFGAASTATIGLFISSRLNFVIHERLGLLNADLLHPIVHKGLTYDAVLEEEGRKNTQLRADLTKAQADLKNAQTELRSVQAKYEQAHKNQLNNYADINRLNCEVTRAQNRALDAEKKVKSIQLVQAQQEQQWEKLAQEAAQLRTESAKVKRGYEVDSVQLKQHAEKLAAALKDLKAQMKELQGKYNSLELDNRGLQNEKEDQENSSRNVQEALVERTQELDQALAVKSQLLKKLEDTVAKTEEVEIPSSPNKVKASPDLQEKFAQLKDDHAALEIRLAGKKAKIKELNLLRKDIASLRAANADMRIDSEQKVSDHSKEIDQLLEGKKKLSKTLHRESHALQELKKNNEDLLGEVEYRDERINQFDAKQKQLLKEKEELQKLVEGLMGQIKEIQSTQEV